jgi:outer membrane protein OmpA-like peptidoglycan-associated protein
MRRLIIGSGLLALAAFTLSACVQQPADRTFPVFFTNLSANLDPAAMDIVASAAQVAKRYPNLPVKVLGYSDQPGSPVQAVQLSQARVDAVAAVLQQNGVPAASIVRDAVGTPPNSQPGLESRRVEIDIDHP